MPLEEKKLKKKKYWIIVIVIIVIVVVLYLVIPKPRTYEYAAKYLCGTVEGPPTQAALAPGEYRADVNVHNPNSWPVTLLKKVVSSPVEPETGKPSRLVEMRLGPDEAFQIDCGDIASIRGTQLGFDKGFVILRTPDELDVVNILTVKEEEIGAIPKPKVPPVDPLPPSHIQHENALFYQIATFIVRGRPVEGLPYELGTKLTVSLPWVEGTLFNTTERIEEALLAELVPVFGEERARNILAGQRVEYLENDPVFIDGSVSLDFELIPGRPIY